MSKRRCGRHCSRAIAIDLQWRRYSTYIVVNIVWAWRVCPGYWPRYSMLRTCTVRRSQETFLLLQLSSFFGCWIGRRVSLERFSKGLGLYFFWGLRVERIWARRSVWHWARSSTCRAKTVIQDLDEIRGKQSHHAFVAAQPAHPPGPISSIQAFYQISFDEAQVSF
jgi:hypothetical protein